MNRKSRLVLGFSLLASATPLAAQTGAADAQTVAAKFGARQSIQQISLSPDGRKVAIIMPRGGGGERLFVADLIAGGAPKPILNAGNDGEHLRSCKWATDAQLVCRASATSKATGQLLGFSRMFVLDSNGGNVRMLTDNGNSRSLGVVQYGGAVIDWEAEGKPGSVLMTRAYLPENATGTRMASSAEGFGVELVDIVTLKRRNVERPRTDAIDYVTDGKGDVRIMGMQSSDPSGYAKNVVSYLYRKRGSRDWEPLAKLSVGAQGAAGFRPVAVDSALDVVYGFDDRDGYRAVFRQSLDGSARREAVVARNDVDIDELVQIGRNDRVVGVSYATDKRTVEFFDPELKKLGAALGKALPHQPLVTFVDASADESRLLLVASSDADPGTFYIYDKATRGLEEVLPVRGELAEVATARVTPVSYPAADGTMIPGYLTLPAGSTGKNLPAIVMPHGGPGARDEWGFDWFAQFFAARGFAVLQPNFRGSAGYGAAWFRKNGFQSWKTAIGDVNDAGRWLNAQGIAAPGKLGIVGWSYGGYAALQSPVLDPDLYKAIVAVAPVTDLDRLREESRNYSNFRLVDEFIGSGPHVKEGSPAQNAAKIKAPVLLFHGTVDQNVGVGESRLMADKLKGAGKSVELVEFPGLDHQLDDTAARTRMLATSDAFLRKALGL